MTPLTLFLIGLSSASESHAIWDGCHLSHVTLVFLYQVALERSSKRTSNEDASFHCFLPSPDTVLLRSQLLLP